MYVLSYVSEKDFSELRESALEKVDLKIIGMISVLQIIY